MTTDSDPASVPDADFVTEENTPTPDDSRTAETKDDAEDDSKDRPKNLDQGFVPGGGSGR